MKKKITEHERVATQKNKEMFEDIADDKEALMKELNKAMSEKRYYHAVALKSIIEDEFKEDALKELREEQAEAFKMWLDAKEQEKSLLQGNE